MFDVSMSTGWRLLIGSPKLQFIFHKRATKYRSLLRKMTYKDKGSYESSPPHQSSMHSPFPTRWDPKWSSKCKTKSKSESRNYRSRSFFKFPNEKRPRMIISWFRIGFRFASRWLFRVSSFWERAVRDSRVCKVGSIKLMVSFAEYRLFYRALLQKRPII